MSRGPGRVERAIHEIWTNSPDDAFIVEDLAAAYPDINSVEKKHRVAVLRAAYKVATRLNWSYMNCERPGSHVVFYNPISLRSYAISLWFRDFLYQSMTLAEIGHFFDSGERRVGRLDERNRPLIEPGGTWWRHVEIEKARRAGDQQTVDLLRAEAAAELRDQMRRLSAI